MLVESKKRILLVEDISDVRYVFEAILENDYLLLTVNSPEEAMLVLPSFYPEALILPYSNTSSYNKLLDHARYLYPICYFAFNDNAYRLAQALVTENDAVLAMPFKFWEFLHELQRISGSTGEDFGK